MHIKTLKGAALVLGLTMALAACKKEDPVPPTPPGGGPPPNEQELITTVKLHFHSMDGIEHKLFVWRDLDGDGGNPPVITGDTLTAGQVYEVHVELLDETQSPPEDITGEIEEEADEHQFFYIVAVADAMIAYTDADDDGNPVGLETLWTVGAAGAGTVTVILRHDPDKDAPGVAAGDITNAGGDTDIQVGFPLTIE